MPSVPDPSPVAPAPYRANAIMASATVLALVYLGREVLIPITLAILLSLLVAPVVRRLRKIGLGHGGSVFVAVFMLAIFLGYLAAVVGSQVVHLARSLPQYETTIQAKVHTLRDASLGRLEAVQGSTKTLMQQLFDDRPASSPPVEDARRPATAEASGDTAPLHLSGTSSMQAITHIFSSIWVPLQSAGIILVVLFFVLLEYESLRDRFIRLVGGTDLRATTAAINDASERLSRFFASQFAVNFGVGILIWLGLTIIGVPSAPLWGIMTALLRFVPYVGVWLAAIFASILAAAVEPGWSMMVMTVGLYLVVELIVGQVIEPQLYGHTTGLSPLAVVVAAIFWSWLWGPVGLIVSTPLSLCLVVAGRHVKALMLLDVLLGDLPALTMPQRFYQRALSGDSDEIIADARSFLRRKSFAAYCDVILLPALQLARNDLNLGVINQQQQVVVRTAIVRAIESLGSKDRAPSFWRRRPSVLEGGNLGMVLRQQRESTSGRWQGSLKVAPRSVVLCVGLGGAGDDLCTEILARILRDLDIDARHFSLEEIDAFEKDPPEGATVDGISMVYLVSIDTLDSNKSSVSSADDMRGRFPDASIVIVLLPQLLTGPDLTLDHSAANHVTHSFEHATQLAIAQFPKVDQKAKPGPADL
jgi:predicted PurR-regulated permease PerM